MSDLPSIGLFGINMGACADPDVMARVATLAEEGGYDSVWTGEHIVLPDPQQPPSPLPPGYDIIEPIAALSYVAAVTSRVDIGTGIIILPQRQPTVLAKGLASADVLSGGRILFGVGVGYLEPEMTACGVPLSERGARTMEYLEAMRALWAKDKASFDGQFVQFTDVGSHPRPVNGDIPVIMGGMTAPAFRRTATHGHGWYGFMCDPETSAKHVQAIGEACERYGRPDELGDVEITVTPIGRLKPGQLEAYAEAGVHRLVLAPRTTLSADELIAYAEENAPNA